MTDLGHNNPPFKVLELTRDEYEVLQRIFNHGAKSSKDLMVEIGGMSSADPRATHRAMLMMAAASDADWYEHFQRRMGEI